MSDEQRVDPPPGGPPAPDAVACPYCGTPLRWGAHEWAGHGVYQCAQCGEFPDFTVRADEARTATDKDE